MEFLLFKTRLIVAWFFKNIDNFSHYFFFTIVHLLLLIYLSSLRFNVSEFLYHCVSNWGNFLKGKKKLFYQFIIASDDIDRILPTKLEV